MKKRVIILFTILLIACIVSFIIIFKATEPVREAKKLADQIKNNATVYLNDGLTGKDIEEIRKLLDSTDGVTILKYTSKADALEEAKEKLAENADLLNQYTENNHPFPASFKIDIDKKVDFDQCVNKIKKIKNVKDVKYYEKRDKLYKIIMKEGAENFR